MKAWTEIMFASVAMLLGVTASVLVTVGIPILIVVWAIKQFIN
jgi:hypothetical protein